MTSNSGTAILNRLIEPERDDLSIDAARFLVRLDFPESDHARMSQLSATAATGLISPDDREELEEYLRVADFLAVIQSKARRSLARVNIDA